MGALVERLRRMHGWQVLEDGKLRLEAAEEIERLTHLVNTPKFEPFETAVRCDRRAPGQPLGHRT